MYFQLFVLFGTGEFLNIYQKNIYKYDMNLHCSVVIYFLNLFSFFYSCYPIKNKSFRVCEHLSEIYIYIYVKMNHNGFSMQKRSKEQHQQQ